MFYQFRTANAGSKINNWSDILFAILLDWLERERVSAWCVCVCVLHREENRMFADTEEEL